MLTSELVRARRRAGRLEPSYLVGASAARMLPVAGALIGTVQGMVGETRDEITAALAAIDVPVRDRKVALGLRKLVDDRCEYDVAFEADPERLREEVFLEAARRHRALDVKSRFDREAALAAAATRLALPVAAVEKGLFADLRGSEVLRAFRPFPGGRADGAALVARYNLALPQAMLLRARHVVVRIEGAAPATVRRLFRTIRFHGLLHVVRADGDGETPGYTITIDGPLSLFGAAQRYGLKLALVLPAILSLPNFRLRAEVLWGKSREPLVLELGPGDALAAIEPEAPAPTDLDAFRAAFDALGSPWRVAENPHLFRGPGGLVIVPDLRFTSERTGEEVFLERFGFWSRDAVWQRVEACRQGLPARFLLAVPRDLRVSEDVLDDAGHHAILLFKSTLSPKAVLDRLG